MDHPPLIPADDLTPKIITACGNISTSLLFLQSLRHRFPREIKNVLSLDHHATVQVYSSPSLRSSWSSPKFSNQLFLIILSRLRSVMLLMHLLLPQFSLPVIFPLICFDTALCQQPAFPPSTSWKFTFLIQMIFFRNISFLLFYYLQYIFKYITPQYIQKTDVHLNTRAFICTWILSN